MGQKIKEEVQILHIGTHFLATQSVSVFLHISVQGLGVKVNGRC